MKAYQIIKWGEAIEEREVSRPVPKGSEVLIRVTASGICHSDLHIRDGFFDLGDGKKISLEDRGIELPFTMGHEVLGEVVELGAEASGVQIGEKRIIYPWIGCGDCDKCKRGDEPLCMEPRTLGTRYTGGYAEFCLVPHSRYLIDFTGVNEAYAATCACSSLTAFSALKKLGAIHPDEWIMIIGAGGVGLSAVGLAKTLNKNNIVVADIDSNKRSAALTAGANEVVNNAAKDSGKAIVNITNGGPGAIIDFVGNPDSLKLAIQTAAKGAIIVTVGLYGGAMKLSIPMLPLKMLKLVGSYVGSLEEMHELMKFIKTRKATPVPITRRPMREAPAALEDLRLGKTVGRFVLTN